MKYSANANANTNQSESKSTKFCRLTLIAARLADFDRILVSTLILSTSDSQLRVAWPLPARGAEPAGGVTQNGRPGSVEPLVNPSQYSPVDKDR